jgi:hypothetical protein
MREVPAFILHSISSAFFGRDRGRACVCQPALDRTAPRHGDDDQSADTATSRRNDDGAVGNKLLPTNIRQDIIERTDGIPLFVEEMTKAVLEAETESEARQTVAAVPSPALAVPASLHASLMARLDRLGPAKEIAQIGAAVDGGDPVLPGTLREVRLLS